MKKITQLFVLIALTTCLSVSAADKIPLATSAFVPVNDDCSGATTLTVNAGSTCNSSTTVSFAAATSSTEPLSSCSAINGKDIWYQFTATSNYHTISLTNFTVLATGQPIIMSLYQGSCGSLTEVACSNNNSITATQLVPGSIYKVRLFFNLANPSLTQVFNICVTTPPSNNNQDCSINTINYSFEIPAISGNGPTFINHNNVQGWRTTNNDGMMEFWPSPSYEGVSGYQGTQYIELNANANQGTMGVYQDFSTPQPTVFTIKFAHRGRMGTDSMKLLAGNASQPTSTYTQINGAAGNGNFSTGNTAWVYYGQAPNPTLTYTVPAGQTVTRFYFQAVSTATGDTSVGNFLDAISFTALNTIVTPTPYFLNCGENTLDIQATGIGTWTAHADNPGPVTFTDVNAQNTTVTFTVPGTYYFDWGNANCSSTMQVDFTGLNPDPPVVTTVTYCQGQQAVPLTGTPDPGNTLVWYYNGGEYIGTGPVPGTSALGTSTYYVVQRNIVSGCEGVAVGQDVIVNSGAAPVTNFTLPATVCEWAGNVTPTLATGFTAGGTFTATPVGLSIDGVTGEIDPAASMPGAYTVTYAIVSDPQNCAVAGSSSDDITIEAAPQLLGATPLTTCDNDYDGLATFNLTAAGTQVANGQTNLTLTYHLSQADAEDTAITGIATPSTFTTTLANTQTVYIRAVFTGSLTNCYTIKELVLTVNPKPAAPVVSNYVLCDDPATTGNVATFDLTTKDAEATANVAGLTVTYYTTQAAADSGTGFITNAAAYNNTSTPQTIWVRVQNSFGCYSTGSFNLIVNPLPVVNSNVEPYQLCDDGTGQATFILSSKNNEVTNNTPGYTITYYGSQGAANDGLAGALPDSYYTADTTVYARVVNAATGCFTTTSVALQPLSSPTLSTVAPLEACATDVSNTAVFNLTPVASQIVGGQPGYTATFYTSQAFADTGGITGQITSLTDYTSISTSVYVRVVATGVSGNCYSVSPIQLIVHPKPIVPSISDYVVCDNTPPSQDGVETFDLTTKNTEATIDPTDTVTYYTGNTDAQLGENAITNPASFQNSTSPWEQTIYVRVETVNGCVDTGSFKLIVNPLPLADLSTPDFYACEETPGQGLFDLDAIDPVITGGQPYLTAYYATEQDIEDNNQIQQSPYLSATGTIYAVVTDAVTGCNLTAPVSLIVAPAPIAPEPLPIEECDDNNDGVATFNIQPTLDAIIAALGGTVSTTVHETQDDANYQEGTNPITDITSYENLLEQTENGIQTLWIRVNSTQTECYDVVSVDLVVHERPVATDPLEDFHMCDNGDDDSDGTAIFDLTSYAETVLNTMDPAQYSVNYYETLDAAENGGAPISSPATYASESGTVYLTVTNNATGCYDVVALELVVDPLPVANDPLPYTLCDEESLDNGIEEFDLTSVIPEITENIPGVAVSFYHDYDDAVAGTNAITTPSAYSNDASPAVEAIYVKVEDNETGCYRIVLLDIRVAPLPQLTNPTVDELTVCDTNGQGYGNFDLDALVDGMVNNGVDITVAFYETAIDAENGLNPITNTSDYQNVVATTQTLYVVATNTETGCRSVLLPITLVVAPAPVTVDLEDLTLCDQDSQDQNGQTIFDLTQQNAVIETQLGVAAGSLTIHYFTDPGFAEEGMPRITVPQTYNGTDGQRIWVRIENPDTECYQVASFVLHVNTPLELGNPGTLTLCNEELPNETPFLVTTFDLTVKEDDILTPQGIGSGHVVEYFETDPQAVGGATAIPNPETFENTSNPQTLYVRVTTPEGCLSYGFLTVRVTPLPTPDETPDALELCDDNTPGDGFEAFDLTEAAADIRDNQSGAVLEYYTTQAAAELGDTTDLTTYIATPANYTNTTPWSDSVWVRVTLTGSQPNDPACAKVVELPLIVNPLPPVTNTSGNIDYYAICEPNSTGYTQFDLMGHITGILTANGATPADYTIRFYLDAAAQTAGTALPYVYTNTVQTHQTILVYVQNNATECDLTLPLDLYAEEAAIAYPILSSATITECDYDGANDGTVSYFDLTPAGTEALGTQDPAGFGVEYYTTEAAAEAGDTTAAEYIATPTAYTNESSPQTIWVRITNLTTISGCHDVTSFTIAVETLAEPVISTDGDDHTICVDFDGTVERSLRLETGLSETGYTFEWFLNGADVTADPTQSYYIAEAPGDYTVVATSTTPSACQSQPSAAFNVIQSGQASIIGDTGYVVSNAFGDNQTITVLVEGNGEYQYTIVPEGNEPVGPWQNSNVFTNMAGGYFDIYVRDIKTDNPCDMLQIGGVSVIDYPRFFTPNGDGINDYWNVSGMEAHPEARIYIFDRYGKLLKQLSPASRADQGNGWDGTFNGTPLPSDDYWFRVEFTEGGTERVFKAHFAMKR